MPTRWETFPVELSGGLVSNLSRLQQGIQQPGSARVLENFEPSIKGGYRRINGFTKYDDNIVPPYGFVVTQGSGQTGTTLDVASVYETPVVGDTFTVAGVTGTYTVTAVAYDTVGKSATLTFTPALNSSPSDKSSVTFTAGQSRIEGVYFSPYDIQAYALRGGALWKSEGLGWTLVNVPSYGTVTVDGGAQTGASISVSGISADTYVPQVGDTFIVDGIEKTYTVTAIPTVTSGSASIAITPNLDSSPANGAGVAFLSSSLSGGTKARFNYFNFNGFFKSVMVDGVNNPVVFTDTSFTVLQGSTDITGASFVEEFKDHLFFSKSDLVTYSAPFNEEDFTPANGAGSYRLPDNCTGLITFRESLINFSQADIKRLQGTSLADFTLTTIANDLGCVSGDTIQEVGGDVLYLAPDGVRFLGATERIGDFNLSNATRQIQDEFKTFINPGSSYETVVVRGKNQYRIFKYDEGVLKSEAEGFIGTQFLDQNAQSIRWGSTKGIKVYRSHSSYTNDVEYVIFSGDDQYVFRMESGSTFDGVDIDSFFYTPYMSVNDPTIRKTAYKLNTYFDAEGDFNGTLVLKYDFNNPNIIQPNSIDFNAGGAFSLWGQMVWGVDTWGGLPDTTIETSLTGSFFTVSFQYEFMGGEPFVLDTAILEYSTNDRK